MTYSYFCTSCDSRWDQSLNMADRDKPISEPCPECKGRSTVKRGFSAPSFSYGLAVDPAKRAGNGWKETLQRIKKASGRENSINV